MRLDYQNNEDYIPKNPILLRDASVISDSREGIIYRLEHCKKLIVGLCDGIEVTLGDTYVEKDHIHVGNKVCKILDTFDFIVFHLHSSPEKKFGKNSFTEAIVEVLHYFNERLDNLCGVVLHPNQIDDFRGCKALKIPGCYLGIEVLGVGAGVGCHVRDIRTISENYPFFDLVLDTAHIEEMIPYGEPAVDDYIKEFGNRIKELHLSWPKNYYDPVIMGNGFDTSHSLIHFKSEDLATLYPCLPLEQKKIYVIEGVIPPGKYGYEALKREVEVIRRVIP